MPIYEYRCRGCGNQFEKIVYASSAPECPSCNGQDLEKQISTFAVSAPSAGSRAEMTAGPCGTCGDPRGAGACSMN